MSQGKVSSEERNAYVDFKEGQNERKAQHHDDTSQTLRLVRIGLFLGVVFALVALSIYAFEKAGDKSSKLANRSLNGHFYKTVTFELTANEGFEKSASKLCRYLSEETELRREYAEKARELGAEITVRRLMNGCGGERKALAAIE